MTGSNRLAKGPPANRQTLNQRAPRRVRDEDDVSNSAELATVQETRKHLSWALNKISKYDVNAPKKLQPRVQKRTRNNYSGTKKRAHTTSPALKSVFNPAINLLLTKCEKPDPALSLLFFIESNFGLRYRKKKKGEPGYFYSVKDGSWEKWAKKHICQEPELSRLKRDCENWVVEDIPKGIRKRIRSNLSAHPFAHNPKGTSPKKRNDKKRKHEHARGRSWVQDLGEIPQLQKDQETAAYLSKNSTNSGGFINFELLPTEECTLEAAISQYRRNQEGLEEEHGAIFDYDRLREVFALKPERRFWGKKAYFGYTALEFKNSNKVVLVSPIYGNAIYMFRTSKWKEHTNKFLKEEIRAKFPKDSRRIVHRGDWIARVRAELGRKNF